MKGQHAFLRLAADVGGRKEESGVPGSVMALMRKPCLSRSSLRSSCPVRPEMEEGNRVMDVTACAKEEEAMKTGARKKRCENWESDEAIQYQLILAAFAEKGE